MRAGPGETLDSIVYPDLRILQSERGYRFSLDPVLLAASIINEPASPVVDLGCGCGVISLLLARRWPRLSIYGLEIQESMSRLARRNVLVNRFDGRLIIIRGDVRRCRHLFRPGTFGSVLCNPPYRRPGRGRISSDPERAVARHEILMSLADLVSAADHLLSPQGCLWLTWKPDRMNELARELRARQFGLSEVRAVRSRSGDDPFLMLCRIRRDALAAAPTRTLPMLTLYEAQSYTPEAAFILRHGAFPCDLLETGP